jgi:putative hemolysin
LPINAARGELSLRLARSAEDIHACQRLRYRVFYEELAATPTPAARRDRLDADRFDEFCDHLLVIRQATVEEEGGFPVDGGSLVGTYRLLRQEVAESHGGFYTQDEFDIAPVIARHPQLRFLELGRSCVLAPYRTKPVVELLWQGIWNYVRVHRMDVMFGCASLEGADATQHTMCLSFLAARFAAPPAWEVSALPSRRAALAMLPPGAIDEKAALRALPPLVKGYLRLGCFIGDGAVADRQFNTTDVLIMLPVSAINPRYFGHFGPPSQSNG